MARETISIATDLIPVLQASREIDVHFTTIYRWVENGVIFGIKVGGILFIPKSEIERLKLKDEQAEKVQKERRKSTKKVATRTT
jgi:predicted site-specific integrase-resolvase